MKKEGCFYNPRPSPGRCIKDSSYGKIDKQCEMVDDKCKLSSQLQEKSSESIPQTILHVNIERKRGEGNDQLSGPVSAYLTRNQEGVQFQFFGDVHRSTSGQCAPCETSINNLSNLEILEKLNEKQCWDISVLLANIFTQAANKGEWVDFYLEIPYLTNLSNTFNKEFAKAMSQTDYLYKLYLVFYNCFHKLKCNYSTTRFHYIDVRLNYKKVTLPEITEEMRLLMQLSNLTLVQQEELLEKEKIETDTVVYEAYLSYVLMKDALSMLQQILEDNDRENRKANRLIRGTDKLMKDLFFSGGQTMTGVTEPKNVRLFKLYLTSDNFVNDVRELLEPSFNVFKVSKGSPLENALFPPHLIVERDGKVMHKIRAQLYALEKEGQKELADKIVEFLVNQYLQKVNNKLIINIWSQIIQLYENFTNSRYRSLNDAAVALENLKKEYKKVSQIFVTSVTGFSLLMDAYTLARIFRKFTESEKRHISSNKRIVYAGQAHIETYLNFFENVLGLSFTEYFEGNSNKKLLQEKKYREVSRCLQVNLKDFIY
jgi:hypothetical protein